MSSLAHADAGSGAGQKPPCVPASSYTLAYDCELFPLPSTAKPLPAVAPPAAPIVAVVPAGAAGAAVPAPASEVGVSETPPSATPAPPSGEASVPTVPAPRTPSSDSDTPSHAPAYVAFVVGAGGIGMTVAFGILALHNKSTLNGECTSGNMCPSTASSTVSSLKTDDNLADIGLGVAVAGVTVGAILFATEHKSSTTTGRRHVEPWIGLGAGGLKGSF